MIRNLNPKSDDFNRYSKEYPTFAKLGCDRQEWLVGVLDSATGVISSALKQQNDLSCLDKDALFEDVKKRHRVEEYFVNLQVDYPIFNPRPQGRNSLSGAEQVRSIRSILTAEFDALFHHYLDLERNTRDSKCEREANDLKLDFLSRIKDAVKRPPVVSNTRRPSIFMGARRVRTASDERIDRWIEEVKAEHGLAVGGKLLEWRESILKEYRQLVAHWFGYPSTGESAENHGEQPSPGGFSPKL